MQQHAVSRSTLVLLVVMLLLIGALIALLARSPLHVDGYDQVIGQMGVDEVTHV